MDRQDDVRVEVRVEIEFRCPRHPRRLFGKQQAETRPDPAHHTLEFACRDCGQDAGGDLVLHLFGADGSHRDTITVPRARRIRHTP